MSDEIEVPAVESEHEVPAIEAAPEKPKRGRKPKDVAPVESAPEISPARASEADELPRCKFKCHIPGAMNKALEAKTEVEAPTAADAEKVYMEHMGIVSVEGKLKVKVERCS